MPDSHPAIPVPVQLNLSGISKGDPVTADRGLPVLTDNPRTAFGELAVAEPTPVIQVDFIYNLNSRMVASSVTGSGTATQANSMGVVDTTAAASSSAQIVSRDTIKYKPGQGVSSRFTALFTTGAAGSSQIIGVVDNDDGFAFGFDGATFGLLHRNNGVDTWIAQTAWNRDKADGTGTLPVLDPTKINVFQISFQYLGSGGVCFFIEDPVTTFFVLVHIIEYANANIVPSLANPSLPMCLRVENTSNTSAIIMKSGSMMAAVEGRREELGPTNGISNTKNVGSTETNVLTIRNRATFNGLTNRVPVFIIAGSVAVDGTKSVQIRITLNATLGGTPSFTDVDTDDSVIEFDTAGTTLTGGNEISSIGAAKVDSVPFPAGLFHGRLYPGETLTVSASTPAGSSDVLVSLTWVEDH